MNQGLLEVLKQQLLECPILRKNLLKLEQHSWPVPPYGRQHGDDSFLSLSAPCGGAGEEEGREGEEGEGRRGAGGVEHRIPEVAVEANRGETASGAEVQGGFTS